MHMQGYYQNVTYKLSKTKMFSLWEKEEILVDDSHHPLRESGIFFFLPVCCRSHSTFHSGPALAGRAVESRLLFIHSSLSSQFSIPLFLIFFNYSTSYFIFASPFSILLSAPALVRNQQRSKDEDHPRRTFDPTGLYSHSRHGAEGWWWWLPLWRGIRDSPYSKDNWNLHKGR